jgi:hypothetical protein
MELFRPLTGAGPAAAGLGGELTVGHGGLVRLKASVHRREEIPLWRSLTPVTESNGVTARRRGEQQEVKG